MASTEAPERAQALDRVQKIWTRIQNNSPVYQFLLSDIEILSASQAGSVTARLALKRHHLNSKGVLHGTVSAGLVDWAGGMAIAATGLENSGVSTDIHTTFISSAKEGDTLEIKAQAAKVGGTLAYTNVEISKMGKDGASSVVSMGSHTKYVKQ